MSKFIETPTLPDRSSEERGNKLSHMRIPLTLTDCHNAMLSTIEKAQRLTFGIAERKKGFFRRGPKDTTLQDACAELDVLLGEIIHQFILAVVIDDFSYLDMRQEDLLRSLAEGDKDLLDSSGTYLVVFKHC